MPILRDCKSSGNNEIQFEASDFYLVYRDGFGSKGAFFGSREAKEALVLRGRVCRAGSGSAAPALPCSPTEPTALGIAQSIPEHP